MKPKHIAALVTALALIATVAAIAAERHGGKAESGIYRLKSQGQPVAEIRILAQAKMRVSPSKIEVGSGRTIWRGNGTNETVTARLLVEGGRPIEFTAEEIELDREVDLGLNNK